MKNDHKVSMKQIAEKAGLSESSVCHILNGSTTYAEKTRKKVLKIADELKYRPNMLVKSLQSGTTKTIGVMVPGYGFYGDVVKGIHEVLLEKDYMMLHSWNPSDVIGEDDKQELKIIHQLLDRRVDGIILRPVNDNAETTYFKELYERNVPFVVIDRKLPNVECDFIGNDESEGGRQAAIELLKYPHKRVIGYGTHNSISTCYERLEAFQKECERRGVDCELYYEHDSAKSAKYLDSLFKSKDAPTAVFCYNDNCALQVYQVAKKMSLKIPEQVSVIGYSDKEFTSYLNPELSTFDQQSELIGSVAAQTLLTLIEKGIDRRSCSTLIKPKFVCRDSHIVEAKV